MGSVWTMLLNMADSNLQVLFGNRLCGGTSCPQKTKRNGDLVYNGHYWFRTFFCPLNILFSPYILVYSPVLSTCVACIFMVQCAFGEHPSQLKFPNENIFFMFILDHFLVPVGSFGIRLMECYNGM